MTAVRPPARRDATRRVTAIRVRPRTVATLAMAGFIGIVAFCWPFVAVPGHLGSSVVATLLFGVLLLLVLAVVLAEVADGGIDAKALALLGVLSAVNAGIRTLGAGTGGIETVFFLIVLAARVFGPGFGFTLGCTSLFASALITGGVGPWLPYQMFGCATVGLLAGVLPPLRGRLEIGLLAIYGAASGYLYGLLLNLSFWPFSLDPNSTISYQPGLVLRRAVAPLPRLRRDHFARLGHRPRGHQFRRDRRCRPGRPGHPAPGRPQGRVRRTSGVHRGMTNAPHPERMRRVGRDAAGGSGRPSARPCPR